MALRVAKKDVKKSSYYVWFLGAQEARTATGARQALGALARLEARAAASVNNPSPPTKVTLQVSGRGLKIIQNVAGRTVKHLLPADSVTEARSKGDAVVCILLLYNPATRCPLHAHAYRCDSEQTAQALCNQLRAIANLGPEDDPEPEIIDEIPSDIESRDAADHPRYNDNNRHPANDVKTNSFDKRAPRRNDERTDPRDRVDDRKDRIDARERIDLRDNRIHSRDRVDSRERVNVRDSRDRDLMRHAQNHDSRVPPVEMRLAPEQEVVAERLAAELRTRLAGREPLLLPPRDYDTTRRGPAAVPQVSAKRIHRPGVVGSSAGSSGIGSDLAPSPERPHTSSEEDWNDSTAYMLHEGYDVSASPRRGRSPSPTKHHVRTSVSPKDRFNVAKEKFLNLEREKINDEIEKRVQMRKNLNLALSRGPLLPSEIKKERRSNNWDVDDDGLIERRRDFPRAVARSDHSRDMRRNDFRDERLEPRGRESREVRDFRDSRYGRDMHEREYREHRSSRELRDPLDMRELREQRPIRDDREERVYRDYRERTDPRDYRDFKEPSDGRERYMKNGDRNANDYRDVRDSREVNHKESRDYKYGRDYRDEIIEEPSPRKTSREKTPQLEQRYLEYKGERSDKYFENRYTKHDSRSDDEGVESEKQFEEIRYVPHVELPRRREVEPKIIPKAESKKEPVRDGRIELLEERQRQIESGRIRVPPVVDQRFDRNMDPPVMRPRESNNNGEWDVIRRSYGDADRPRRDPRTRHSYAEPVARTRVGMATVVPF